MRRYDTELKKSLKDNEFFKDITSDMYFDEWNDIQANIDSSLEPLKKFTLKSSANFPSLFGWDMVQ